MKKNFTFILLSLLLLLGGAKVCAQTVNLPIKGGKDWSAWTEGYEKGTGWSANTPAASDQYSGTVKITNGNPKFSRLGGKGWSSSYNGQTQTFTMVLNNSIKDQWDHDVTAYTRFVLVAIKGGTYKSSGDTNDLEDYSDNNWDGSNQFKDGNGSNETKIVANSGVLTPTFVNNEATIQLEVNEDYDAVYFYTPDGDGGSKAIKIVSFTLTIGGGGSSVAAPTISPASGTYDGELSVTITPGDGNDHVIYSVEGSNEDAKHTSINITSETTINLTGDGTITVTATGYDSENNPSSEVTNTYTYSVASGKTTVSYAIPGEVEKEMRKYDFESGDDTGQGGSFSGKGQSGDDSYAGSSHNLWLKNDNYGGNDYSSQIYLDLNTSDWPVGTKITLSFYAKGCDDFEVNTAEGRDNGMKIAIQEKDSPWRDCAVFTNGVKITKEWAPYVYHATIDNTCSPNRIYFNCGNYKGSFRFDNIIITKTAESATGGSNVFTSDDQVANIGKSEFSSLKEGDYICANVTGSPETIKLVCSGNDYALSQFNGGNLWGVKATAAMVTALSGNDSEFKGHDLTLNGISIYETTAVTETNTGSITKKNNTFVELTRSFTKDMWNTVCLPFAPTAAQADELFGSGYKIAKFTGVSETTMEFTSKDKEAFDFVAGQPYLVKPTENLSNSSPVVLADVNITAKNGATVPHDGYSFTGTFTTKSFAKGDWATTRFVATGNKLNTPNSENAMKALRCYFTVPAAKSLARGYAIDGFMDDDVPTDISATLNDNVQTTKVIYNLAGQRVANPTKGLYIVNGQKVVVK